MGTRSQFSHIRWFFLASWVFPLGTFPYEVPFMAETAFDLRLKGEVSELNDHYMSNWNANMGGMDLRYADSAVSKTSDGGFQIHLTKDPVDNVGYVSGEVRSSQVEHTARTAEDPLILNWTAKSQVLEEGSVFGLFAYNAGGKSGATDNRWWEADMEIMDRDGVGGAAPILNLAIHMARTDGTMARSTTRLNMDFDPSQDFHHYEMRISTGKVEFWVDDKYMTTIDASKLGGAWHETNVRAVENLWLTSSSLENWSGTYQGSNNPLTAYIKRMEFDDLEYNSSPDDFEFVGTTGADTLIGTDGDNLLRGYAGDDTLRGGAGKDTLLGHGGHDNLYGGSGKDVLTGGWGNDTFYFRGPVRDVMDQITDFSQVNGNFDTISFI